MCGSSTRGPASEKFSFFAYDPGFTGGRAGGRRRRDGRRRGGRHHRGRARGAARTSGSSTASPAPRWPAPSAASSPSTPASSVACSWPPATSTATGSTTSSSARAPGAARTSGCSTAVTGALIASFFAYAPAFTGGVRVAAADVNVDGRAEIVTGAGPGGGPHVRVFDRGRPVRQRQLARTASSPTRRPSPAASTSRPATSTATVADIVTGAGAGGGPHVRPSPERPAPSSPSFFAYAPGFTGGVRVGTGDVNGDGRRHPHRRRAGRRAARARSRRRRRGPSWTEFFAFNPAFTGRGVRRRPPAVGRGAGWRTRPLASRDSSDTGGHDTQSTQRRVLRHWPRASR